MKRWLIAATILTLAASVFVFVQAMADTPLLRLGVPGQWTWRYDASPYFDRALLGLVAAALLGWLCHWTRDQVFELRGGRLPAFLLAAVCLTFVLQMSFAYLSRSGFGQGVFWMGTPKANADFAEACKTNTIHDLLVEAQNPNRPLRIHLSMHPPGTVLFYRFQKRAWETAPEMAASFAAMAENALPYAAESRQELEQSILARPLAGTELATLYGSILLLWLVVALGVVPLYFWAADLFGPSVAVTAVGLYALTPSFLLFNPMTDQLYAPFALTILAACHLGWSRGGRAPLVFAGLFTWLALQLTLAFFVVLLLFGVYVGLEVFHGRRPFKSLKPFAWPAGVFLLATLLCLPAHYNCLLVWKLCAASNALFLSSRSYGLWGALNPLEFALFLGVAPALFLLRGIWNALSRREQDSPWRFVVALTITILLLDLSGGSRGEVARVWMFLMPMATAIAAFAMRHGQEKGERNWGFLICYGLLFVQSVLFKLSFDVLLPSVR